MSFASYTGSTDELGAEADGGPSSPVLSVDFFRADMNLVGSVPNGFYQPTTRFIIKWIEFLIALLFGILFKIYFWDFSSAHGAVYI